MTPRTQSGAEPAFDFGANWADFSAQRLEPSRLEAAERSIRELLGRERLDGLSILDVGCGSGLFSIAASRLGAARVVAADVNPKCLEVCRSNVERLAPGARIETRLASALDDGAMAALGEFDLVYAWGSLHHTGGMWEAIRLASARVAPGGSIALAIYNRHVTSPAWRWIKRFYNVAPRLIQRAMAGLFAGVIYVAKLAVTRRNPLEKERGMDFWFDVVDWIGGYPYEYASPAEVESFMKGLGFEPLGFKRAQVPTGCNEFVFQRGGAPAR